MKQMVKATMVAIIMVIIGSACTKQEISPESIINNVTLETSLQAGQTYTLDLSAYSEKKSRSIVSQQPSFAAETTLTPGTCQTPATYVYRAGQVAANDQVMLQVTKNSKCNKTEETTNITINIKTEETRSSGVK